MRKKIIILLGLGIMLLSPSVVLPDCISLGRSTSSYVEGSHAIIFYEGLRPIARLEVPYCALSPSSSIRLIESYVCDGDKIMIDDSACMIMTVSSASTVSY